MMKVVLSVEMSNAKTKKKVLRAVSDLLGIMSMDIKENKIITVIGSADVVEIVRKIRKVCPSANIISAVGTEEEKKKKEESSSAPKIEQIDYWAKAHTGFQYCYPTTHYYNPYW